MAPQAQTLFAIALFLALSSLFAWKIRRTRGVRPGADKSKLETSGR